MKPRYVEHPRSSPLLAEAWREAREAAYTAGRGPEFDALTTEIEALRASLGENTTMDTAMAMHALAQRRRALIEQPSHPASSAA